MKKPMKYVAPPPLEKGDRIAVTCPASKIEQEVADYGCAVLQSWGFEILRSERTIGSNFHNFAATDEIRREELQKLLDDVSIRAIVFGRGGYGVLRILDQLDFGHFIRQPKWICGYSDITALHLHIHQQFGIQTLHSLMCSGIKQETKGDQYVASLKTALRGLKQNYRFQPHALNKKGVAQGALVGGNLSLMTALCGSLSQPDTKGKILFIEDIAEYIYIIDRMMLTLKRAGLLENLAGLIVGGFTDLKDTKEPFGQTIEELISDKVKDYHYPVSFNFPTGHQKENFALKEGARYQLEVGAQCALVEL